MRHLLHRIREFVLWLRRRARDLAVCVLWLVLAASDSWAERRQERVRQAGRL